MRIPAPLKKYQLTYVGAGKITHSVQIRAKSKKEAQQIWCNWLDDTATDPSFMKEFCILETKLLKPNQLGFGIFINKPDESL